MSGGIKKVKEAEIIINGEVIEIMGIEREEAWEFIQRLNEEDTQKLIYKLRGKMSKIERKLELTGYFFNDDIENSHYLSEVIVYFLNNIYGKYIDSGKRYGHGGRAIYYDPSFIYMRI